MDNSIESLSEFLHRVFKDKNIINNICSDNQKTANRSLDKIDRISLFNYSNDILKSVLLDEYLSEWFLGEIQIFNSSYDLRLDLDLSNTTFKNLNIRSNNKIIMGKIKFPEAIINLSLYNCKLDEIDLTNTMISSLFLSKIKTPKLILNNCTEFTEILINKCDIKNIEIDNETSFNIDELEIINSDGLENTKDPKYFYIKNNLNKDSAKRGWAAAMDSGLFDFKIN